MGRYFEKVEVAYFHLTSLLLIPFRNLPIFPHLLRAAEGVDRGLLKIPASEDRHGRSSSSFPNPSRSREWRSEAGNPAAVRSVFQAVGTGKRR